MGQPLGMSPTLDAPLRRTFAQWYCVVAGAVLVIAGLLGFIADSSFDTGGTLNGDKLFGLEVNGWHNVVHLASGVVLLAAANTRPTARSVCWAFAVVYGIVFLWGLIDGNNVLGVFPINPPDNVLHLVLAIAAGLCAYVSPTTRGQQRERRRARVARRRSKDDDKERQAFIAETERDASSSESPPPQ
jgi:Domain of unknown function (DUF4383)